MSVAEQSNKALVLEAMTALFQRHDASAVERLYALDYIQHNPGIPQGRDALAKLVEGLPSTVYYEPGLIIAEGDFVAIHGRIRGWAPNPQIAIDIFRIADGRLAEHWDVLQDEAPAEGATSGLAMFSPDEAEQQAGHRSQASPAPVDFDRLMKANMVTVFSERNPEQRLRAIRDLYSETAILHEPQASVRGHAAISDAVDRLLAELPGDFVFTADGPAIGHNGIGRLKWSSGPKTGPVVVTGLDVAQIEDGRIVALHVFLDPPAAVEGEMAG